MVSLRFVYTRTLLAEKLKTELNGSVIVNLEANNRNILNQIETHLNNGVTIFLFAFENLPNKVITQRDALKLNVLKVLSQYTNNNLTVKVFWFRSPFSNTNPVDRFNTYQVLSEIGQKIKMYPKLDTLFNINSKRYYAQLYEKKTHKNSNANRMLVPWTIAKFINNEADLDDFLRLVKNAGESIISELQNVNRMNVNNKHNRMNVNNMNVLLRENLNKELFILKVGFSGSAQGLYTGLTIEDILNEDRLKSLIEFRYANKNYLLNTIIFQPQISTYSELVNNSTTRRFGSGKSSHEYRFFYVNDSLMPFVVTSRMNNTGQHAFVSIKESNLNKNNKTYKHLGTASLFARNVYTFVKNKNPSFKDILTRIDVVYFPEHKKFYLAEIETASGIGPLFARSMNTINQPWSGTKELIQKMGTLIRNK